MFEKLNTFFTDKRFLKKLRPLESDFLNKLFTKILFSVCEMDASRYARIDVHKRIIYIYMYKKKKNL